VRDAVRNTVSPSRSVSAVESTMSVKRTTAMPDGAEGALVDGVERPRDASIRSGKCSPRERENERNCAPGIFAATRWLARTGAKCASSLRTSVGRRRRVRRSPRSIQDEKPCRYAGRPVCFSERHTHLGVRRVSHVLHTWIRRMKNKACDSSRTFGCKLKGRQ
jgi:hypothetical protein